MQPEVEKMVENSYNSYQEYYQNQNKILPERSYLYPLKPFRVGSNKVESLTSYVTRLAAIHQVPTGVLLAQEVAPFITRCYNNKRLSSRFFSAFFCQTGAWNGTGIMALSPVSILQKLTQQPSLRFLTLLMWAEVLPRNNLLRPYKAWCPLCYSEADRSGMIIYEPLDWSILTITVCLKHQQVLLSRCPNCGSSINYLSWNSRAGFCSTCHHWLGNSCNIMISQI
ncbi:MAG: TniQ family protein [Calothrix sp. SM1_7_51]|nr:TniQ family protein [Calothrix sp. SM1_7_51]